MDTRHARRVARGSLSPGVGPLGFYRPRVFVVGPAGRLAHVHRGYPWATFRNTPELLHAIEQARAQVR